MFVATIALSTPLFADEIDPGTDTETTLETDAFSNPETTTVNPPSVGLFREQSRDLDTTGMSLSWTLEDENIQFKFQASLSRMSFLRTPEEFNRRHYLPAYGSVFVQMNSPATPYFEMGIDLGDLLLGAIFDDYTEYDFCCDVYGAIGITFNFGKRASLSAYRKAYNIRYQTPKFVATEFNPVSNGIQFAIRF